LPLLRLRCTSANEIVRIAPVASFYAGEGEEKVIDGGPSVLTLMIDLLLALLWMILGFVALLWLAMVSGLLWSATTLVFPRDGRVERSSGSDTRFLRSMHIQP